MNPNAFALIDIIIENEQWDILSSFNIFTYDEDALNEEFIKLAILSNKFV